MGFLNSSIYCFFYIVLSAFLLSCETDGVLESVDNSTAQNGFCPTNRLSNGLCPSEEKSNITSVQFTSSNGFYGLNTDVYLKVTFNQIITVSGTPQIELETGATDQFANYVSGSGTKEILFKYSVVSGDTSSDLDYKSSDSLSLNGGSIINEFGNNSVLTLPVVGTLAEAHSISISTALLSVTSISFSSADGNYSAGSSIDLQVTFNNNIYVDTNSGIPQIELETGTTDRFASYLSGSGTTNLIFRYTVQAGDYSTDLDYKATNSLSLNGATIKDIAQNDVVLTLPSVGTLAASHEVLAATIDSSWDFSVAGSYTYPSNYVEITAGQASLKLLDTLHSTTEFNSSYGVSGSFQGIYLDGSNNLTLGLGGGCDASLTNCENLDSSWTPKWENLVGYWKMDNNFLDSSGNNMTLTAHNDPSFVTDTKVGTHSALIDTDDAAQVLSGAIDTSPLSITKMTLMAWVKIDSSATAGWRTIMEHGRFTTNWYGLWKKNGANDHFHFRWSNTGNKSSHYLTEFNRDTWYHIVGTYDPTTNIAVLYTNGVIDRTTTGGNTGVAFDSELTIGSNKYFVEVLTNSNIDEVAIFNEVLDQSEIERIYNRQKHKFSGHYDSPIIDLGTSGAWTDLTPISTLPFNKNLAITSESSNYPSSPQDLSNGLVSYWSFDGTLGTIADSQVVSDVKEINNLVVADADATNTIAYAQGILGQSISIDGADDSVAGSVPPNASINISNGSIFAWIKTDDAGAGNRGIIVKENAYGIYLFSNRLAFYDFGGEQNRVSGTDLHDGKWHHVGVIFQDGVNDGSKLYIDGKSVLTFTMSVGNQIQGIIVGAGNNPGSTQLFKGNIDEAAVWNRPLTELEIKELYRRGANRIKYQVKSCVDSSCNCKSFSITPAGSSADCDGNGILNSSDPTDTNLAHWLGSNGADTSFSEQQNCSTLDASGKCSGSIEATAPIFNFTNFPVASQPSNNQYFQYRVIMEADENTACTGVACLPELTSVKSGPTGRYYGGSSVIKPNTPVAYTYISQITFTDGGCSVTYQLSFDGTTYRYWNGTLWAVASGENVSESASGALTSANITSFAAQAGTGNLYWKAFFTSDTSTSCQVSNISVTTLN